MFLPYAIAIAIIMIVSLVLASLLGADTTLALCGLYLAFHVDSVIMTVCLFITSCVVLFGKDSQ